MRWIKKLLTMTKRKRDGIMPIAEAINAPNKSVSKRNSNRYKMQKNSNTKPHYPSPIITYEYATREKIPSLHEVSCISDAQAEKDNERLQEIYKRMANK